MVYASANRLHQRLVRFEDELLDNATLLPFFDRAGNVRQLLLIDLADRTARVLDYEPGSVRLPLFKKEVIVRRALDGVPDLDEERAAELGELWHFDPWWLLDLSPFDKQATTPILKLTNCVDLLAVEDPLLGFTRDLARVTWVFRGTGDQRTGKRWKAKLLPDQHPNATSGSAPAPRVKWVLDPIWERR